MVRKSKRIYNNFLFSSSLLVLFLFLSLGFLNYFDLLISENISTLWNPFFNPFFIIISQYIFDTKVLCVFTILFFFFNFKKDRIKSFLFLFIVGLTAIISEGAKYLFSKSRPINSLILETSFSFPSSHSSISFVLFLLIYFYFEDKIKNKKIFLSLNIFLILLIGFSRIYLNVHYLSDVLGGYLLGAILLIFLKKIRYKNFDSILGKLY
jgi:undecaprenyl-diphosphatase